MKNLNIRTMVIAASAAMLYLANSANAQYQPVGDDGIAASPKARQAINETKKVASPASKGSAVASSERRVSASPKGRQFLDERKITSASPSTVVSAGGYRARGDDGIAASPKMRQQLDERRPAVLVAPLK